MKDKNLQRLSKVILNSVFIIIIRGKYSLVFYICSIVFISFCKMIDTRLMRDSCYCKVQQSMCKTLVHQIKNDCAAE